MKRGLVCLAAVLPLLAADRKADDIKRIDAATTDLIEIMHAKDGGIPETLMQKAECVGIIPGAKRAGFIVGVDYGKGIITCRIHDTNRWSAPAFIQVQGGSFGLQIGAGETDVVFTVMNESGVRKLLKDKVQLGVDVAGMAGPVGRNVQANTDVLMRAEMLSWSRARGVFAGVDLKGATLHTDHDDDVALYGPDVTHMELLRGKVPRPAAAERLYRELERYAHKPVATKTGD
ncbi:MAG TPA: lipid-binding SYLF domain-containing protein [Bryobacteraceae bacterium]|nr:lipid-binding SYLF domain-containing protein [Bryobacteraceae bacterium]